MEHVYMATWRSGHGHYTFLVHHNNPWKWSPKAHVYGAAVPRSSYVQLPPYKELSYHQNTQILFPNYPWVGCEGEGVGGGGMPPDPTVAHDGRPTSLLGHTTATSPSTRCHPLPYAPPTAPPMASTLFSYERDVRVTVSMNLSPTLPCGMCKSGL